MLRGFYDPTCWPEYQLVEDKLLRQAALKEAMSSAAWSHLWRFALAFAAGKLFEAALRPIHPLNYVPRWAWTAAIILTASTLVGMSLDRRYRRAFWLALHRRGVEICTECGYSRKGHGADAACSECGHWPMEKQNTKR